MKPEERVACGAFGVQSRVTPICVFRIGKIGVSELDASLSAQFGSNLGSTTYFSLFCLVHGVFLVVVDANVLELTHRPTDGFSMQFLEPSFLHSVADNRYPCGIPALTRFRMDFCGRRA